MSLLSSQDDPEKNLLIDVARQR